MGGTSYRGDDLTLGDQAPDWGRGRGGGRDGYERERDRKKERREEPLPPTPHILACFGSWRTVSSYSLGSYARAMVSFLLLGVAQKRGTNETSG